MATDTEILVQSQAEARSILDASLETAEAIIRESGLAADHLLREQTIRASDLLLEEQDLAIAEVEASARKGESMDETTAGRYRDEQRLGAKDIRARRAQIAGELVEAEATLALSADHEAGKRACEVLMDAHREAAGVLLAARLRVEDLQLSRS